MFHFAAALWVSIAIAAGGLDRRQSVVIVERMELREMQDRRHERAGLRRALFEAQRAPRDRVLVSLRPAVHAGHHAHAVGPQRVELAHLLRSLAVQDDRLDVGVAGEQEMRAKRLQERRALLARIGPREQRGERMRLACGVALVGEIGHRRRALGDKLHRAVHDRVADEALAGERRVIARRPARPATGFQRDQMRGARGLGFAPAETIEKICEHKDALRAGRRRPRVK